MKRILIIDDEEDILTSLGATLRRSGYRVWGVATGEDGLKVARQECPDLIILDLILPDKDGSDVAADLLDRPSTRSIPIIFLTSMMRKDEQLAGGSLVAKRCIVAKPCRSEEILTLIKDRIGPAD
jgi:DNA-binding response OmpR family regulator